MNNEWNEIPKKLPSRFTDKQYNLAWRSYTFGFGVAFASLLVFMILNPNPASALLFFFPLILAPMFFYMTFVHLKNNPILREISGDILFAYETTYGDNWHAYTGRIIGMVIYLAATLFFLASSLLWGYGFIYLYILYPLFAMSMLYSTFQRKYYVISSEGLAIAMYSGLFKWIRFYPWGYISRISPYPADGMFLLSVTIPIVGIKFVAGEKYPEALAILKSRIENVAKKPATTVVGLDPGPLRPPAKKEKPLKAVSPKPRKLSKEKSPFKRSAQKSSPVAQASLPSTSIPLTDRLLPYIEGGRVYERCPKCENYAYLSAVKKGQGYQFTCSECLGKWFVSKNPAQ